MLIDSNDALQQAFRFIDSNTELAFDIETDGLNTRRNVIIGFGVTNATEGFYLPIKFWDGGQLQDVVESRSFFLPILNALRSRRLVTWNGAFDIPFTKNNLGIDLIDALHADVMLMKHTVDEEFPFGLKEVAAKIYGHDVKSEKAAMLASIEAAGGTSKEYYKASTDTIAKYCLQDCRLTFRLYGHYSKELKRQGLENFYYNDEVMPLYREVTIPMQEKGVGLDVPKLERTKTELEIAIANLEGEIQMAIQPYLAPVFTPWFLNKDYPPKTPTGKQPAWAKAGLTQSQAWQKDNPQAISMFNLQSKHHLKKLFFETLGCTPLNTTPTGLPQVDEEFLESVSQTEPWVPKLIAYNKLNKLYSTYVVRLLEESENGIFYPSFMQHRTVSGRYGSDLQQLPRPLESYDETDLVAKYTSVIREFIIPIQGSTLISADYEQLEPSVFAHNSGDSGLIAIFNSGVDFYSEVAIRTEGLQGVSSDKTAPNYLGKVDKAKRQKAKSYALGIAYGMTAYKLKFEINADEHVADQLVKDYYAAFPKLKETMDALQASARTQGFVVSAAGRVRHMPQACRLFNKYGPKLSNGLELWKAYNTVPAVYKVAKEDAKTYKNLMNNALNFPIQTLAASIVNRACIAIARRLKTEELQAYICMQIHDEVVCMASEAHKARVAEIMQEKMQGIVKLSVPLRASPVMGQNFRQCK